jgi:hypothetical protein
VSDRVLLQTLFNRLLLVPRTPWAALNLIVDALHKNWLRLWCEGNLLNPSYIRDELRIDIEQEAADRWRLVVRPARIAFDPAFNPAKARWEVDVEGVKALLPPPPPKRGRKSVHNWHGIVYHEYMDLQSKGSPCWIISTNCAHA